MSVSFFNPLYLTDSWNQRL